MKIVIGGALLGVLALAPRAEAVTCTPTGFFRDAINMTAALINPPGTVTGTVDATGCNVGVYYDAGHSGTVKKADIFGANYFGVLVNGDAGIVTVNILNSSIHDIGETPLNGTQHGNAIYYRGFYAVSRVRGTISGNKIWNYQKGGIIANGKGTQVEVVGNLVTGAGQVTFIAQNGIQVGFGALGSVTLNTVSGNSYIGFPGDGSSSAGILVVGGPYYGPGPDALPYPYSANTFIFGNILKNNDVGVYVFNADPDVTDPLTAVAPATPTKVQVLFNFISNGFCWNQSYQAGVSDFGNKDVILFNTVTGSGYSAPCGLEVDTAGSIHPITFGNR